GGDFLGRLAAELVSAHGERLGDVAARENLDALGAGHEAMLLQQLGRHFSPSIEALGNRVEIDDGVFDAEWVVEAALRNATVQRHLAAFETALVFEAGTRLRALVAAPGRLAVARPLT